MVKLVRVAKVVWLVHNAGYAGKGGKTRQSGKTG